MNQTRIWSWIASIGAAALLGGLLILSWEYVNQDNAFLKPSQNIIEGSDDREVSLNGSPFSGLLPWEASIDFLLFKEKHGEIVRMAAFRTHLPDPLPGEEFNVRLAADRLSGTIVQPGEIFSQNHRLGPYTASKGFKKGPTYVGNTISESYGGGVCKIASTLYNVVVYSNLQVIERHPHGMTVPYVPPGQDATVSFGSLDFRFRNTSGSPVIIWSMAVDNTLYMAFYGKIAPPRITWHHRTLAQEKHKRVFRFNPSLPKGQAKITMPGSDGLAVKSWITIYKDGGQVEIKDMGISYYRPLTEIIEHNP
ncbi:MAG: VanW family protein [Bacillota bacterium]